MSPLPSRHDTISVTIDRFHPLTTAISYTYRCINKVSPYDLCNLLLDKDWSAFALPASELDIKQGFESLTYNLQGAIQQLASEKSTSTSNSQPPMINAELRLLRSNRDATGSRYDRTGSKQLLDDC